MKPLLKTHRYRLPLILAVSGLITILGGAITDIIAPNTYMLEGGNTWNGIKRTTEAVTHIQGPLLLVTLIYTTLLGRRNKALLTAEIAPALIGIIVALGNLSAALQTTNTPLMAGGYISINSLHNPLLLTTYSLASIILTVPLTLRLITTPRAKKKTTNPRNKQDTSKT